MSNFFISTDMTADFPPELKGEDFRILPMSYVLDGVEYDGVTRPFLTPHEFYTALERGAQASTSMVPVESAKEYFLSMLGEGKDILHISFPAAMSGCYDGYLKAAPRRDGGVRHPPPRPHRSRLHRERPQTPLPRGQAEPRRGGGGTGDKTQPHPHGG